MRLLCCQCCAEVDRKTERLTARVNPTILAFRKQGRTAKCFLAQKCPKPGSSSQGARSPGETTSTRYEGDHKGRPYNGRARYDMTWQRMTVRGRPQGSPLQ
jgi:hypothetical protein